MQFFFVAYACTNPIKESVRFLAAKIHFGPLYLLAHSILFPAISETRLPSAHVPSDSIVDQKLVRHFAHFTTPALLATSKQPEVTDLCAIQ